MTSSKLQFSMADFVRIICPFSNPSNIYSASGDGTITLTLVLSAFINFLNE